MTPPSTEDRDEVGIGNRLWRMEQRLNDMLSILTVIRAREDEAARKLEEWHWRTEGLIAELGKRLEAGSSRATGVSNELVKIVVWGLLAGLLALAGVKIASLGGLIS